MLGWMDICTEKSGKNSPHSSAKIVSYSIILLTENAQKRGWLAFLAIIPGTPSQGIPKQLEFAVPERVYQVSQPGRANKPLSWAFADKRIFPNFAFFGPKVDQI